LYGKENENHELGTGFFVHKRIISAYKGVELVSDRMSYIILRKQSTMDSLSCKTLLTIASFGFFLTVL
jgi:hypothetical protein